MPKSGYPLVDLEFLIEKLKQSNKLIEDSESRVGSTISFIVKGNQPLYKRTIYIRNFDGEVNFFQATSLAILYGFMGDLLIWYHDNKNWKEGGYIVPADV